MAKKKAKVNRQRIIKGRDYRDNKNTDGLRSAKPRGYRFTGEIKRRPTKKEIESFHATGKPHLYYERRPERSDFQPHAKRGMRYIKGGKVNRKQTKQGIEQDKNIKALHAGKRIAKDSGSTYFESRPNRSDANRIKKLKTGGKVNRQKQTKAGVNLDKHIKAKKAGKRVSAEGNTYYESRSNRSDKNLTKKLAKGGDVKSVQSMTTKELAKKVGLNMRDVDKHNIGREDLIAMVESGEYKHGGKVNRKKKALWIQDALSGNKGALRAKAKRAGLIKGDEKLSLTDIRKLEKKGGKTGKEARLAETLMSFSKGGSIEDDLKRLPDNQKDLTEMMELLKATSKDISSKKDKKGIDNVVELIEKKLVIVKANKKTGKAKIKFDDGGDVLEVKPETKINDVVVEETKYDTDKNMALMNLKTIHSYAVKIDGIVTEESDIEDWAKMKLTRIEQNMADVKHVLAGGKKEKLSKGGEIFKSQLLHIAKYAKEVMEMVEQGTELKSWMEGKLAVSAETIDSIYHSLDYKIAGHTASQFKKGGEVKMHMTKDGDKIKYAGSYGDIEFSGEGEFDYNNEDKTFSNIESEFEAKGKKIDKESMQAIRTKMLSEFKKLGIDFKKGGEVGSELSVKEIEKKLGRKLHWWHDDIVETDCGKYKKCRYKPFYKKL